MTVPLHRVVDGLTCKVTATDACVYRVTVPLHCVVDSLTCKVTASDAIGGTMTLLLSNSVLSCVLFLFFPRCFFQTKIYIGLLVP